MLFPCPPNQDSLERSHRDLLQGGQLRHWPQSIGLGELRVVPQAKLGGRMHHDTHLKRVCHFFSSVESHGELWGTEALPLALYRGKGEKKKKRGTHTHL